MFRTIPFEIIIKAIAVAIVLAIAFAILSTLPACSGGNGTPSAPIISEPTGAPTEGYCYDPVATDINGVSVTGVSYKNYCSENPTAPALVTRISDSSCGRWRDIPFPHDGTWYCGITAIREGSIESGMSKVLGVEKVGSLFYQTQ